MANEKLDVTELISEGIGRACYLAVAKLATQMANGIVADNKFPQKSKREIFQHVAKEFNKATSQYDCEVIVVAAPGIGRGPMIRVQTKVE